MHTSQNFTQKIIAEHLRFTETWRTQKVVAHSSGLQKLENSNLKILKFEARFAYAVKFWTDFFDWILHNFFQMTHSATIFFVYFNAQLTKLIIYFYFDAYLPKFYTKNNHRTFTLYRDMQNAKSRKPLICLQKLLKVVLE